MEGVPKIAVASICNEAKSAEGSAGQPPLAAPIAGLGPARPAGAARAAGHRGLGRAMQAVQAVQAVPAPPRNKGG